MKIRILVADDHDIVRAGLKSLLERQEDIEIVGEAADGRELVRLAEKLAPSIVVTDIAMPLLNGIDATAQILHHDPDVRVIILSMYADEEFLVRALTAGVKGYLVKGVEFRQICCVLSGPWLQGGLLQSGNRADPCRRLRPSASAQGP